MWGAFDLAYKMASESSQPLDWMEAALIAQQIRYESTRSAGRESQRNEVSMTPHESRNLERNADKVNGALQEYLLGYEFRGDGGDHTPTEAERLLIEDAIQGLLVDEDFIQAFVTMHNQSAEGTVGQSWAKLAIAMLHELRMDYAPGALKDTDGVQAIKALRDKCAVSAIEQLSPPTADEIGAYRDLFRRELDKRMDTNHPSGSPSTEAHGIALRNFIDTRNKARRSGSTTEPKPSEPVVFVGYPDLTTPTKTIGSAMQAIEPTEAMLQAALDADIGTLDTPLRELYRLIYVAMRRADRTGEPK